MQLQIREKQGLFDINYNDYGFNNIEFQIKLSDVLLKSSNANLKNKRENQIEDKIGKGKDLIFEYEWSEFNIEAEYHLRLYDKLPCASIYINVKNKGKSPVYLEKIKPLVVKNDGIILGSGLRDWVIYKNGIRKNDLVGSYHFGNPDFDINDITASGHEDASFTKKEFKDNIVINSSYLTVLNSASTEKSILTGFYTMNSQFTLMDFKCDKNEKEFISYETYCTLDGIRLESGNSITSEKLLIDFEKPFKAIKRYSNLAAETGNVKNKIKKDKKQLPTGWCSWYFFYESVTEKDVLNNMEYIKNNNIPVEYIQIDMGWEQRLGDLYPNYKFPHGMKWLADKIHSYGYKAGIWVAPFWVEPRSQVHREHPEWLLEDKNGDLIIFNCHIDGYVIDPTVPEARQWIIENFRRIVKDWDYDYVKIDFLRAVSLFSEACYTNQATRAEALRLGMEAVREGVGEETFILACGGHYGPTLGIADGNRMSNDIGSSWESLKFTFKKNISRYWTQGTWWVNDPDCLLLRGPEEGTPGKIAGHWKNEPGSFTETEVKTILTIFRATGGMVFLGDDLTQLKQEKIDLLTRWTLPPTGRAAVPRDMFENRYPHILHTPLQDGKHEVAVINWGEKPLKETFALKELLGDQAKMAEYQVTETWSNNCLGVYEIDEEIPFKSIEPHGCIHLKIVEE